MPKQTRIKTIIMLRTAGSYQSHKRRAEQDHQQLDYTLKDIRIIVSQAIGHPCPYCGRKITPRTFSFDHLTPTSRSGWHKLCNLIVCCKDCNAAKGPLDNTEYAALIQLISSWPQFIAKNTLARLKAGSRIARNIRPGKESTPTGSSHEFTH